MNIKLLFFIAVFFCAYEFSFAKESVGRLGLPQSFEWDEIQSGPFCGVFAASRACRMIGLNVVPSDLLKEKYVGNCKGSTPEEVSQMIEDSGGKALILNKLSSIDLRILNCPVIASVRSTPNSKRFDHWVLVMPDGDGLWVADGKSSGKNMSFAEFSGTWNGLGVVVAKDFGWKFVQMQVVRLINVAGLILASFAMIVSLSRLHFRVRRISLSLIGSGLCILLLSAFGSWLQADAEHFWLGVISATAPQSGTYHTGMLNDAVLAGEDIRSVLVDARRKEDFNLGSIPGAVNIPVSASRRSVEEYLKNVSRDTKIVVFCQSSLCGYDEQIASTIVSLGFTNVIACSEGWAEYSASRSKSL